MSRPLIQFSHLFKSFGSIALFEDISFSVNEGELIAVIGENGSGKTTFLQILAGIVSADVADFVRAPTLSIEFVGQEITLPDSSISVREFIEGTLFSDLEKEMELALADPNRLAEWEELHEQYEQQGGYNRSPLEQVLVGLKLHNTLLATPISHLSSGELMRSAIAKALIKNPELLLLDEPTNYLDQEMVQWLECTLKKRRGACVLISHDRAFLNSSCTQLIEIKNRKLFNYKGNYDFYLVEQEQALQREIKAYQVEEEKKETLRQKLKEIHFSSKAPSLPKDRNFIGSYDTRGEKYQRSAQRRLSVIKEELKELESHSLSNPKPKSIKGLHFSGPKLSSTVIIEIEEIEKSYENKLLFSHFSKNVYKGDRILITGLNGCGKTTLLHAIAGTTNLDFGSIRLASSAKIGFLSQEMDPYLLAQTPLEYFENEFHLSEEGVQKELHKAGLGGKDLLQRPFSTLSSGQRRRLLLLGLVLEKPNILLLDEPTTHLDFRTLEAFENALLSFDGVIIAVSHDIAFIKKIATQEWGL